MAKEYSTLKELYEDTCSSDEKKSKTNKWFMFSRCYDFVSFFRYYNNITKLSSQPDFNKHEVISKYFRDH